MNSDPIQRYNFSERFCHWFTSFAYLYCLATGLAFYAPFFFWMAIVLGGGATSRYWHPIFGVVFVVATAWMHRIWRGDVRMTAADQKWLDKAGDYVTHNDAAVPAQDRFNAGQKLFYWAMYYGAIFLVLSGVVMWFPEWVPAGARWIRPIAILIHEVAALATIGAFIIHIYMGVFVVPGSVHAMVSGFVSREWARAHHRLWYERVILKR